MVLVCNHYPELLLNILVNSKKHWTKANLFGTGKPKFPLVKKELPCFLLFFTLISYPNGWEHNKDHNYDKKDQLHNTHDQFLPSVNTKHKKQKYVVSYLLILLLYDLVTSKGSIKVELGIGKSWILSKKETKLTISLVCHGYLFINGIGTQSPFRNKQQYWHLHYAVSIQSATILLIINLHNLNSHYNHQTQSLCTPDWLLDAIFQLHHLLNQNKVVRGKETEAVQVHGVTRSQQLTQQANSFQPPSVYCFVWHG